MTFRIWMLCLSAGMLLPLVAMADYALEQRVDRLERIVRGQGFGEQQLRIQRLQQEVQTLRGQVERQARELEDLRSQVQSGALAPASGEYGSATAPISRTGEGEPAAPANPSEHQAYRDAFELLKQRRYDQAIDAFKTLIIRYPGGELVDNAYYWLGEAYYVKQDYAAALETFDELIKRYPLSPKLPGAMLKSGYAYYELGDWEQARTALQGLIDAFPTGTEARLAQERLARMDRNGR